MSSIKIFKVGDMVTIRPDVDLGGIHDEDAKKIKQGGPYRVDTIVDTSNKYRHVLEGLPIKEKPAFSAEELEPHPACTEHEDRVYSKSERRWVCPFCQL